MTILGDLLDFFLPTACAFCGSSVSSSPIPFFCTVCWSDFSVLTGDLCPRCGKPFESPEALSASPDHCCGTCRLDPPVFDQALSIGFFEGSLREAIHQFKYRPCSSLGQPLGTWMAENIRTIHAVDVVMPIPLHRSRLHLRGFNQALLLAARIGEAFSLPVSFDNLCRTRPTRPQVELSGPDRVRNVAGAFSLARVDAVKNRSILLIDDVFTTGATINECAKVLKQGAPPALWP